MKNITTVLLIIVTALSVFLFIDRVAGSSTKKIGIIQMEKLVYDFKGMKEATDKYSQKLKNWNNQTDSLEKKLKQSYEQIRIDSINNDKQKLERDIQMFLVFKQSYMDYTQSMQENAQKEDKDMTVGVMNQINEYIKEYAKEEGFDVILCNNNQYQSIGFAKEQIDITQKILEYSNKKYEGSK